MVSAAGTGHGDVEVPWWTYGARGMQLWFPSSLEEPLSPTTRDSMTAQSTDPELEFDREVYPIGISIAEVAIIGQCSPSTPLVYTCHGCTGCLILRTAPSTVQAATGHTPSVAQCMITVCA